MQSIIQFEDCGGWEENGMRYHLDRGCDIEQVSFLDHSTDEEISLDYCQRHETIIDHK